MNNLLKKICESNELISIYANPSDSEGYVLGYILKIDEENLLLKNISSFGKYNGISCIRLENIFKIEYNTKYVNAIKKMISKDDENKKIDENFEFILIDLLKYIKKNKMVCSIELLNSDLIDATGFVNCIEKEYIIINSVTESGDLDGNIIITIDKIERVWCDSDNDRTIQWLYCNKK